MRGIAEIFRSYAEFDANGKHVGGTDKQSNHRYGDAYEQIIEDVFGDGLFGVKSEKGRQSVGLMLEVGVADGSSLLAWSEVFPNAHCVGMDIHHAARASGKPRIELHLGDQRSLMDCRRVAGGREFDFICEDATHQIEDTLLTLLYLWPFVRPGGLYVIEEFSGVAALRINIVQMWPTARIVDTDGPFGGIESLVVLRKPNDA